MRQTLAWCLMIITAACASDTPSASFAVSDSAGVEVVATSVPSWGRDGSPWRLSLDVEIGEVEGAEPYLFGDPAGAVWLPDGGVAVADAQSKDIRFFDPDGKFLRRAGRKGQGPGEFESFSWIRRCGDSLLAYDWVQRRATPISLSGDVGFPFRVTTPETGRPPYRLRCLPDGSFLAVGWGDAPPVPPGEEYLYFSQEAELWRLFPPADSSITIGEYISSERLAHVNRQSGGGGSGPHPFSRSVVFDGDEDHIFIGGAERLQVEVRSLNGQLLKLYRGPDADLLVSDSLIAEYEHAELTPRDSAMRRQLAAADYPMPERYPAYTEILIDPLGYVWVERFALPWDTERRWGVFDPSGVFLGHLSMPLDFRATDVTATHVVGIAHDELGVARVRVYRLDRN